MHRAADIATAKRELRTAALLRRAAASSGAPDAGAALAENFLAAIELPGEAIVAGYWPMRDEIDPRPLLHRLHEKSHVCALCVIGERAAPLRFRAWRPGMALQPGGYGTSVPPADSPEVVPGIVLTPLLAFDERGHRLGYGGGYYDRTITQMRGREAGLLAVGLAFEAQGIAAVPNTPGDARLDWVVTEARARQPV